MNIIFYCFYAVLCLILGWKLIVKKNISSIFSPWPGYTFIFSTYFLLGSSISADPISEQQWALYLLALMGYFFGALLCPRRDREDFADVNTNNGSLVFSQTLNTKMIASMAFISYVITAFLWMKGGVPAFQENVDQARISYASNGYLATLATGLDVAAVFCFTYVCLNWKSKSKNKFFYFACFVVLSFLAIAVLSGSRSRLFKLGIPALLIYHFTVNKLSFKKLFFMVVGGAAFIGSLGFYRQYSVLGDGIWYGLENMGYGSPLLAILYFAQVELSTAAYGLSVVIDVIPKQGGYTLGMLQLSPLWMPLPIFTHVPTPGMYFKDLIGGTWDGAGLAATFIAPMYADLSYPGVFISCAIYSFVFTVMYRSIFRSERWKIYKIAIYAVCFYFMLSGIRSDYVSFEFLLFLGLSYSIFYFRKTNKHHAVKQIDKAISQP